MLDVLETEESCYQSLPSHPAPGLTYQAAAEVCQTDLNGTLVREESLNTTDLSLLLAGVLPYSSPGTEHGWWLAGDDEDVCRQVSVSGVTEEDCEGGGLALCQLGLHCPQYSQDLVGPANCVCGCRHWTAQPTAQECELCLEGEFCYQDYYLQSEYCVQECEELPTINTQPCFCSWEVCDNNGMNYCNLTEGCQYFDSCPVSPYDDLLSNETLCDCYQGGLCNITEYCSVESTTTTTTTTTVTTVLNTEFYDTNYNTGPKTICLARPDDCPELPELSPEGGCTCNSTALCSEGLMCDPTNTSSPCTERPPPCLPFPDTAGPEGCYCALDGVTLTEEICQENEACDTACFLPAFCQDITTLANWTDYNAQLRSLVLPLMIQGSEVSLECEEHTFTSLSVEAGEFEKIFTAVCTDEDDGSWSLDHCTHPVCPPLLLDTDSVTVTELQTVTNTTSQGSILSLTCKDEANEFEFASLTRVIAHCNRRYESFSDIPPS